MLCHGTIYLGWNKQISMLQVPTKTQSVRQISSLLMDECLILFQNILILMFRVDQVATLVHVVV